MACTVILPTLAHSSSSCWWYFLANLMNSRLPTSSPNLSRFWLMRGLILTLWDYKDCEKDTSQGVILTAAYKYQPRMSHAIRRQDGTMVPSQEYEHI